MEPAFPLDPGLELLAWPRASFWQRLAALVIDVVVLIVPYLVLWPIVGERNATLLSYGVDIAYFSSLNGLGQTIGKRALRIRVVDACSGAPIGALRGLLRHLVSIVSFWTLLLGYLWMIWDREKQTWHDKAARDVVVQVAKPA